MNRRLALAVLAGAGVLVALAILLLAGSDDAPPPPSVDGEPAEPGELQLVEESIDVETTEVLLYFPGEESKLYGEPREVPLTDDPRELAAALVAELVTGPTDELLTTGLAPDITTANILISGDGVAFVDLRSERLAEPPVTGSTQERLSLYSLVQTLVHNVPTIEAIVVLWNGRQPQTFGGHIDTTRPLVPDPELLAP